MALYYPNQPQITYRSTQSDENYWGFSYTQFDGSYSFVDGTYTITESDEAGCQPSQGYDCINAQCVLADQYNTPGIYESLEACQAECGSGGMKCNPPNICVPPDHCPDGYVCIGEDEFAEIKRLLS